MTYDFICGDFKRISPTEAIVATESFGIRFLMPALDYEGNPSIIWLHEIRSDFSEQMYGFFSEDQRAYFRTLIDIPKVGGKTALLIMSSMSFEEAYSFASNGNTDAFTKIKGIGDKLANQICLDLGKTLDVKSFDPTTDSEKNLAVDALITLGYTKTESKRRVLQSTGSTALEIIKNAIK